MSAASTRACGGWRAGLPGLLLLAGTAAALLTASTAAGEQVQPPAPAEAQPQPQVPPEAQVQPPAPAEAQVQRPTQALQPKRSALGRSRRSALDARVSTLTRALALDGKQQAELRKVLLGQRTELPRIWNDPTLPSATRVAMTRGVSRETADRIRALLTEEQRKKYNPPPNDTRNALRDARVEEWMTPEHRTAQPTARGVPPASPPDKANGGAPSQSKEEDPGAIREGDHGEKE